MKKINLIFILLNINLFADASLPPQTITKIQTGWGNKSVYLQFKETNIVEGCSKPRVCFEVTHPMFKEILSIALSSLHSEKKVEIRVSGCINGEMKGLAIDIIK